MEINYTKVNNLIYKAKYHNIINMSEDDILNVALASSYYDTNNENENLLVKCLIDNEMNEEVFLILLDKYPDLFDYRNIYIKFKHVNFIDNKIIIKFLNTGYARELHEYCLDKNSKPDYFDQISEIDMSDWHHSSH